MCLEIGEHIQLIAPGIAGGMGPTSRNCNGLT